MPEILKMYFKILRQKWYYYCFSNETTKPSWKIATKKYNQNMRRCKIKCTYDWHLGSILEYHSKGLKLPRWGIFGLPLTQRVKILQKNKPGTSHIMHHTSHTAYDFVSFTKY